MAAPSNTIQSIVINILCFANLTEGYDEENMSEIPKFKLDNFHSICPDRKQVRIINRWFYSVFVRDTSISLVYAVVIRIITTRICTA